MTASDDPSCWRARLDEESSHFRGVDFIESVLASAIETISVSELIGTLRGDARKPVQIGLPVFLCHLARRERVGGTDAYIIAEWLADSPHDGAVIAALDLVCMVTLFGYVEHDEAVAAQGTFRRLIVRALSASHVNDREEAFRVLADLSEDPPWLDVMLDDADLDDVLEALKRARELEVALIREGRIEDAGNENFEIAERYLTGRGAGASSTT